MTVQKVALVTGASSGAGRAAATLLSKNGFRVYGITRQPLKSDEASGIARMIKADVRDDGAVYSCMRIVLGEAGRIDALVNNAGYVLTGALEETGLDEAKALFETNFFGAVRMTQAVLPIMREQRGGRIANIGSAAGFLPAPYSGLYAASKHALEAYSETLDHEVRQFGIRVCVIEPGFIRTDIAECTPQTRRRIPAYSADREAVTAAMNKNAANGEDPARAAAAVLKALTAPSPRMRYIAGSRAKAGTSLRTFLLAGIPA
jgi:short-subunit dehydrogenase